MPVENLKNFLDEHRVKYVSIYHSSAYTAQEIAEASHVPGKEMAKTVMVKLDGELAMVVVPASRQVNFQRLREAIGANAAVLATEDEFRDRFPGCELGAMPPFGNLYGLPVFVSRALTEDKEIAFNAGSHTEIIKLSFQEYSHLVAPRLIDI
ncbi:MAG: aminoacyl-tRNA deacylase [Gammaproteobacteria bacterium]